MPVTAPRQAARRHERCGSERGRPQSFGLLVTRNLTITGSRGASAIGAWTPTPRCNATWGRRQLPESPLGQDSTASRSRVNRPSHAMRHVPRQRICACPRSAPRSHEMRVARQHSPIHLRMAAILTGEHPQLRWWAIDSERCGKFQHGNECWSKRVRQSHVYRDMFQRHPQSGGERSP